jgi:hypothetical protein
MVICYLPPNSPICIIIVAILPDRHYIVNDLYIYCTLILGENIKPKSGRLPAAL